MNRILLRGGIVLLSLVFLSLLVVSFPSPLLYGPENVSSTPHQVNLLSLKKVPAGESAQILPLMQDVMGSTGTITVSLEAKDFQTAERDLRTYLEKSAHLENLILQLNLSDTDLETFRQANEKNLIDLQEMLNLTERFSTLETIEITYRSEDRPDLLYSVSYEGETIRNRVGTLAQSYTGRRDEVISTSRSYGLDATAYEQSVTKVSAIAQDVAVRQTDRAVNLENVVPSPYVLTLQLNASTGEYGDEIAMSGSFISAPSSAQSISLFVDSLLWKETPVDAMGGYQINFPLRHIGAGTHIAYALYGHTYSEIRTFTVRSQTTLLTLTTQVTEDQQILCNGGLYAGYTPVTSAPVEISSDGKVMRTVYTDAQGAFETRLDLSSAEHRIKARFISREFPLEPSESEVMVAPIPDKAPSVFSSFIALAVFAGCSGGAAWFLLRRRPYLQERFPAPEGTIPAVPPRAHPVADLRLILATYWRMLLRGEVQEGAYLLYHTLVDNIARRRAIPHAPSLTPRELAKKVPDLSPALPEFVSQYEKIRYAGTLPTEKEHETLTTRFLSLIRFLKGDSH